jgi:hypothetical protein
VPGLRPEVAWALVVAELPLEQAAGLAEEGRIPRPYLGIVGRRLTQAGQADRALVLLQPLFADPDLVTRSDLDTFDALVSAYEELGRDEEVRAFVERFRDSFLFNPEPQEG